VRLLRVIHQGGEYATASSTRWPHAGEGVPEALDAAQETGLVEVRAEVEALPAAARQGPVALAHEWVLGQLGAELGVVPPREVGSAPC